MGAGLQALGFAILSLKMRKNNTTSGISMKMLQMHAVFFTCRLTSTLNKNGYIPVDRSGDWLYQAADTMSFVIVLQLLARMHSIQSATGQGLEPGDSMWILLLIIPSVLLGFVFHGNFNNDVRYDIIWCISMNLDTVAMAPQLWMMSKMSG